MASSIAVSTTINGDDIEFLCKADETLLDVLRDKLGLMGAKRAVAQEIAEHAVPSWMGGSCAPVWFWEQKLRALR